MPMTCQCLAGDLLALCPVACSPADTRGAWAAVPCAVRAGDGGRERDGLRGRVRRQRLGQRLRLGLRQQQPPPQRVLGQRWRVERERDRGGEREEVPGGVQEEQGPGRVERVELLGDGRAEQPAQAGRRWGAELGLERQGGELGVVERLAVRL
eukprot:2244809-Rhodomonas_salina.1